MIVIRPKLRQRLAERLTRKTAFAHHLRRRLGLPDGAHAMVNAPRPQSALRDLESAPLAQQQVFRRHTHVRKPEMHVHVRRVAVEHLGVHRRAPHLLGQIGVFDRAQPHAALTVGQPEIPQPLILGPRLQPVEDLRLPRRVVPAIALADLGVIGALHRHDLVPHHRRDPFEKRARLGPHPEVHLHPCLRLKNSGTCDRWRLPLRSIEQADCAVQAPSFHPARPDAGGAYATCVHAAQPVRVTAPASAAQPPRSRAVSRHAANAPRRGSWRIAPVGKAP